MTGFMEAVEATTRGRGMRGAVRNSAISGRRFAVSISTVSLSTLGAALLAIAAAALPAGDALAQAWPTKPIHWVVPFTPGALTDVVARMVSDKVAARLGQPVIVENKPGAGGNVGAVLVSKSPADGYTVLLANHPGFTTAPALSKDPGFDPVRGFAPVTGMIKFAMLLAVHPSMPVNNVQEFIAYAKSRPGQLNYASPGVGMPHNLAMVLLDQTAGIELVHVLYKGGAMATQDLLGGRVQAMFGSWVIFGPHLQAGKLKVIGASTLSRLAQAPDIRTIDEQGYPGFDVMSWVGMMAPAGTPADIVAKLASETQAVLSLPEVKEQVLKLGLESMPMPSPAAFSALVRADVAKWDKIIRDANIKPE